MSSSQLSTAIPPQTFSTALEGGRVRNRLFSWGIFEWYVVILLLGSGLVFVPGSDAVRPIIRGMPYALSAGLLVWHLSDRSRRELPPAGKLILPALILYAVNLFHPFTDPVVGLATAAFHISIAAPVFWSASIVRDASHYQRVLWLVLAAAMLNVTVGILQAAFPFIFMPRSFSGVAGVIAQQTYMGPFGYEIVRPPGLSDLPGGASWAGAVAALLGLAFAVRPGRRPLDPLIGLACMSAGLVILYLTQVRSFAVTTVGGLLIFAVVAFYRGHGRKLFLVMVGCIMLVALAGILQGPTFDPSNPYAPGGRFRELLTMGLFEAFMRNRGFFFVATFNDLMWRFPLGAGLGRWGMMREYFGDGSPFSAIWVEVQPTGWLLDGGVLMWVFYGGALLAAMLYSLRLALSRRQDGVPFAATIVLGLQVVTVGSGLAGPVFNTVFGVLFWLLTGALYAVARRGQVPGVAMRGGFS